MAKRNRNNRTPRPTQEHNQPVAVAPSSAGSAQSQSAHVTGGKEEKKKEKEAKSWRVSVLFFISLRFSFFSRMSGESSSNPAKPHFLSLPPLLCFGVFSLANFGLLDKNKGEGGFEFIARFMGGYKFRCSIEHIEPAEWRSLCCFLRGRTVQKTKIEITLC